MTLKLYKSLYGRLYHMMTYHFSQFHGLERASKLELKDFLEELE